MLTKIRIESEDVKPQEKFQALRSYSYIALVVSSYIVVSICMVIYNKRVLNQFGGCPLIFLCGQLFIAATVLKFCMQLKLLEPIPSVTKSDLKELLPLISINVFGLCMNTMCLKYVDAMMYQVARSLVLPITLLLTFLHNRKPEAKTDLTIATISCCCVIFIGFVIGMNLQNISAVSTQGLLFSLASSCTTSIHSIIIKRSFSQSTSKKFEAWGLVYLNNYLSCFLLAPIALFFEYGSLMDTKSYSVSMLLYGILVSGCIGLLINYASFLQIHVTSPLTHTVSSAARGVLQSLVARHVLNEEISPQRLLGILVTLAGTTLYSICKSLKI